MSGRRVLAGLRASVETFPLSWAFPTSESSARYDSPSASGGRSLCQDSSACLSRLPPRRCGASMVPSPGVPCRASRAVSHPPRLPLPGASGASHVLRRLSSGLPRPVDSGGPAQPCHRGWSCRACGMRSHPRHPPEPCRRCTSTAGDAAPPTASRMLCLRLVHRVRHAQDHDSAMDARRDPGGWLTLTRQGLSPCKRRQACLARQRWASGAADSRSEGRAEQLS